MHQGESSERLLLDASSRGSMKRRTGHDSAHGLTTLCTTEKSQKVQNRLRPMKRLTRCVVSAGLLWKHCTCAFCLFWEYRWTAEVCSYLFSLLTFAGLVTTLLVYQNKPIPKGPQLVSINPIISLFSLFMRTGVGLVLAEGISQSKWQWYRKPRKLSDIEYFDLASRSPWGSFLMLCNLKPRLTYCVAALGALTTIMASLTGYFSQQLVQFEACLQRDDATAVTVAKTNNYTAHGVFLDNYTADEFGPMVAAINVGLIQPVEDLANVLTNGCISGNCTFPSTDRASISTIGIGHVCEDMSDYIRQNNGSTMFVGKSNSSSLTIRDMDKTVLVTLVTGATDNPSFGMANISMLFRQHWKLTKFAAIRCSLYPTVFTYGINMTNSVLDEQVVESVPIQRHGMRLSPGSTQDHRDNHTFTHKMATTHTFRNGSREVCIGSRDPRPELVKVFLQRSDTSLGQPLNESIPDVALYYPRDCVWSFGMGASSGILRSLQTIFHNQELVWGGRGNTSGSVHLRALFQPGRMSREDLNAHLQGNISLDTVDDIMKTMTRAMTAVVRTNGYERFQGQDWNAYGDMWYNTTCVRIRWEWIIFPIIMIALTGVFLLLVVFENRDVKSDRLWKSSVLAGMFCEIHIQQGIPVGKEGMVEVAHSTSVSFEEKSETLRLLER